MTVVIICLNVVKPLLYNDREMGGYIRPLFGQRLGEHVPAATDTHATE
jgi:hypothetical protein